MSIPIIVITAYNRLKALNSLLASVSSAVYPNQKIKLIISIDKSAEIKQVAKLAHEFDWSYGEKEVITHSEHMGLVPHFIFCLSLAKKHGNIILLEDDLIVSPFFYSYAAQALDFYENDTHVTGISLYNYCISESSLLSFIPVDDGSDVYFMQYPSSWGLCLTQKNCEDFFNTCAEKVLSEIENLPDFVRNWGKNSWKRFMLSYLIYTNTYFVFPQLSLSTNFSPTGTNMPVKLNIFQVPIQVSNKSYHFVGFSESRSVYDCCFEITPACLNTHTELFKTYDYVVDLQGVRDLRASQAEFVLTRKKLKSPIMTFGDALNPLVLNVINKFYGTEIKFGKTMDAGRKTGNVHYGHAEFLHKYKHKMLQSKLSFIKYLFYYVIIEFKMYRKKKK